MKLKIVAAALILTASPAMADLSRDSLKSSTLKSIFGNESAFTPTLVDLPIEGAFSYFPTTDMGDFTIAEARAGFGLNLGCAGVTIDGSMDAMVNQFKSMGKQFLANAPMIGVNYLVYSQPSLYALIQNLKESTEFMLDMTNFTCQSARQLAQDKWQDSIGSQAAAECAASNGAATAACSNGDSLVDKANKYISNKKKQWRTEVEKAKKLMAKASLKDALGNVIKSGDSCDALDPENVTANDVTLALSGLGCADIELAKKLLPDAKLPDKVEKTGTTEPIPAKLTVEKALADESIRVGRALDIIAKRDDSELAAQQAYATLAEAGANTDLTLKQISMLRAVNRDADSITYQAYLSQVSVLMARNRLSNIVDRLEIGLLTGKLNKDSSTLGEDLEDQTRDKIRLLKAQIDTIDRMIAGQQKELELLSQAGRLTSKRQLPYGAQ